MKFSFGDLLQDIGGWLLFGILLAGFIDVVLSPGLITGYLGNEPLSMLVMVVLATPLYVCATASTPIAAALVMKGLSPGAALVFLMAGPATNVATITVVARVIGKKAAAIYVFSILICSLALGGLVNVLYRTLDIDVHTWFSDTGVESHGFLAYSSTILLLILIACGVLNRRGLFNSRLSVRLHNQPDRQKNMEA